MTRIRISRLVVVVAALGGWLLAFAPAAYAHAELEATNPTNGQHLAAAPSEVTMTFSERVTLIRNGIQVLDRSGQRRNKAEPKVDKDTVRIPLDKGIADGVYTVNWRVVSADSHPVNGAFVFSIGSASAAPLTGPSENSGAAIAVTDAFWLFRWGAYAGMALLVGGAFFRVVCWPAGYRDQRARRIVRVGWITSVIGAVGTLLLQGPNADGSSILNAFNPSLLGVTLSSDFGIATVIRLVLLGVIAALLPWLFTAPAKTPEKTAAKSAAKAAARTTGKGAGKTDGVTDVSAEAGVGPAADGRISRGRLAVLAAVGVAFIATWSWMGHAHVGDQAPLAVVADVAHLTAMSVWVGGLALLTLCVLPRGRAVLSEAARALPRFSITAMIAVGVLVVTGVYAAWREVRSLSALAGTEYGKLLIFKLAAFGVLMALAAMSRSTVQRRYVVPVLRASAAQAPPRPKNAATTAKAAAKKTQREQEERDRAALGALRQSVRLEVGVVVGVLAVTAVLVATPPGQIAGSFETAPASPQTAQKLPFSKKIPLPDKTAGSVRVSLSPARSGDNVLVITMVDPNGRSHDVTGVTAEFTLPANKIGPLPVTLEHGGVGQYTGRTVTLPVAGTWKLTIKVRTSEFDETSVSTNVPVS